MLTFPWKVQLLKTDCGKLAVFSGATTALLFWLTVTLEKEGPGVEVTRFCDRTSLQACVSQNTRKLLGPENGPVKPPKTLSGVSQSARKFRARENTSFFSRKLYEHSVAPEKRFRDSSLQ